MKRERSGGMGIFGICGIVLVVLKLVGVQPVAVWSWFWVLAPFWIGFAMARAITGGIGILMLIALLGAGGKITARRD